MDQEGVGSHKSIEMISAQEGSNGMKLKLTNIESVAMKIPSQRAHRH